MRRLLAISTVTAVLLAALASVTWAAPGGEKGKPDKPTTTTTTNVLEACHFDTDGVLAGWDGQKFGHRCLFLGNTPADYVFEIELSAGALIMRPYLAVSDNNSPGEGICFREYVHGRVSEEVLSFDVSLPGDCGDTVDEFRLTVQGTARGGEALLRMLVPPPATS